MLKIASTTGAKVIRLAESNGVRVNNETLHSGQNMDRVIERRYPKWLRPAIIGAVIACTLLFGFFFLEPSSGRVLRIEGSQVAISSVMQGEFEDFIPIRGRATPATTVYLDAVEGGRVEEVFVEDGAVLSAGTAIVRLSNASLQLDVISREAQVTEQLNNAQTLELQLEQNRIRNKRDVIEANYQVKRLSRLHERRLQLLENGHVSQEEFDANEDELEYWANLKAVRLEAQASDEKLQKAQLSQIRISVNQLQTNLAFARKNLDNLNIKAPINGQLTAFNLEVGQSIARGERVGQIDEPNNFKLVALVDEFYLNRIDIGQVATAESGGETYKLVVKKIYPQVRNGQFEVDLFFLDQAPADLRRGQNISSRLSLSDPSEAILLPNGAFFQDTGGQWVFVVDGEGSFAQRRPVRLGRKNTRFVEVVEGLTPGERVITSTYQNYMDMARLEFNK